MAAHLEALAPENHEAWDVFHRCATRFVRDFHAAPLVLRSVVERADDPLALIGRLSLIYDVIVPPTPERRD